MQLRKTDLFTVIHKAIRSMIYNAGAKLQTADFSSAEETKSTLAMLKHDLELLHEHGVHEDNVIFPAISQDEPEIVDELSAEHVTIGKHIDSLHRLIEELENTTAVDELIEKGQLLNNLYNDFAAFYLAHMRHEEGTALHASQKLLTDEELINLRTRIQSNIPPERYNIWLGWMLKSLNNIEISGLLEGMKAGAPEPVFQKVAASAQSVLEPSRWSVIRERVGIV